MNGTVATAVATTCKQGRRNGTVTTAVTTTCKQGRRNGTGTAAPVGDRGEVGTNGVLHVNCHL